MRIITNTLKSPELGKERFSQEPNSGGFGFDKKPGVLLDEKYFRRLNKFTGEANAYRSWLFDLVMVLNQIDSELADQVNKVVAECGSLKANT